MQNIHTRRKIYLALYLMLALFYLIFHSIQYDLDVLGELQYVNRLSMDYPGLHHPLYSRVGVVFYKLWQLLGYQGSGHMPLKVINALSAPLIIILLIDLILYLTGSSLLSFVTGILLAFTYGFLEHTLDAFFIIPAYLFTILCLRLAAEVLRRPAALSARYIIPLGISAAIGVLFYQALGFAIPAYLAAVLFNAGIDKCDRLKWAFLLGAVAGISILIPWMLWAYQQGYTDFLSFVFLHQGLHQGVWRTAGAGYPWWPSINGIVANILPLYRGLRLRKLMQFRIHPDRIPAQIALLGLVLIVFLIAVWAMRRWRKLWETYSRWWIMLGIWFLPLATVTALFDPAEIKLWLIPLAALWLTAAIVLADLYANTKYRRLFATVSVIFVGIVALSNFIILVYPNRFSPNPNIETARRAAEIMRPEDAILTASFDWTGYLGLFADSTPTVINALGKAQAIQGKLTRRKILDALYAEINNPDYERVYTTLHNYDTDDWTHLQNVLGISEKDFADLPRDLAFEIKGEKVWRIR